ncbi:MAG: hypothetical protein AB7O21_19615 [Gammaproteobacteria bacterium]
MKTHEQFGAEASRHADTVSRALLDELVDTFAEAASTTSVTLDADRGVLRELLSRTLRAAFIAGGKSALETGGLR